MTIPHLMNCPHMADGCCLECVGKMHDKIDRLKAEIADHERAYGLLFKENAGLRKDAERLDWIERNGGQHTVCIGGKWYVRSGYGSPHIRAGNMRAAIDAAKGESHE